MDLILEGTPITGDNGDNGGAAGGKSSVEAAAAADLSETEKANIRKMMEALGLGL